MAEAAYAAGPALLGAPRRAYSLLCLMNFLFPVSSQGPNSAPVRGPKEPKSPRKREAQKFKKWGPKEQSPKRFFRSLFQCGAPKSLSPPENARPKNLKSEGPIRPKRFLFPVPVFQRRAPKSPWSPDNVSTQNLKIEVHKERGPKQVFCSLFQRGIQTMQGPIVKKAPKQGRW
jgi:hypothetical protein